ncbi:MAG TPA: PASTA domain-containing protein [Blastocatellia bacterium]|nr:PASTA domain-containing protein [Blastocatellia bacterium]
MSSVKSPNRVAAGGIAWTISRRPATVVVLGLAFLLSATVTLISLFRSGVTYVPDVIGRSETEAQKMIEQAGLEVRVQRRSDPAPANTVIDINRPPNSSLKKGFTVTIVVSSGPAQTTSELRPNYVSGFGFLVSG